MGRPRIEHYRPPVPKPVRSTYSNDPFWRRAVELSKDGLSWKELARRCDMHPDQFTRAVGLRPTETGRFQERLHLRTAIRLCRGLGVDPAGIGLAPEVVDDR